MAEGPPLIDAGPECPAKRLPWRDETSGSSWSSGIDGIPWRYVA